MANFTSRTILHQDGKVETILVISAAQLQDNGNYSCVMSNSLGWVGRSIHVMVDEGNKPSDLRVVPGVWLMNNVFLNFMDPNTLAIILIANGMTTILLLIFVLLLAKKVYTKLDRLDAPGLC